MSEFVAVCVSSQDIPANFEAGLKKIFNDFQFEIERTEGFNYFLKTPDFNPELLNPLLMYLSSLHQVDVAFIPQKLFETKKGFVVFDMDSTLIAHEVIDEMAARHGVGDKVKLITARAMNGELNFDQSLKERVSLLKGFHRSHMEEIMKSLTFTPGTPEFLMTLKSLGIKTAIASGGFNYFAKNIQEKLQMDYAFSNDLEFEGDLLTGNIHGRIVNAELKEEIVMDLAKKEGLTLDQVVAIGDGANDIPMLLKAGMGIAIHAKEKVQKMAQYRINFGPMTSALAYMNIRDKS